MDPTRYLAELIIPGIGMIIVASTVNSISRRTLGVPLTWWFKEHDTEKLACIKIGQLLIGCSLLGFAVGLLTFRVESLVRLTRVSFGVGIGAWLGWIVAALVVRGKCGLAVADFVLSAPGKWQESPSAPLAGVTRPTAEGPLNSLRHERCPPSEIGSSSS